MGKPRITVVGSTMVDLITYVDRMPHEGETVEAPRFEMGFGGKGANQAVAAALPGADVCLVAKIGDDIFGPGTKRNLERYGIDTTHVEIVAGVSSGVAPIFVDRDSHNSILIIKGANAHLAPQDVDKAKDVIRKSDVVIIQIEIRLESVYRTIEICRSVGVPDSESRSCRPALEVARIKDVTLFAPNEPELHAITGMPTGTLEEIKKAGRSLLRMGLTKVLITLGDKGCLLLTSDTERLVPACRVKSVDTTGAGDAFIGCFTVCYGENGDITRAMETANKYAALSTTPREPRNPLSIGRPSRAPAGACRAPSGFPAPSADIRIP